MGLFGKSKKEREAEYMAKIDVRSLLDEDFEMKFDDTFIIMGVGTVITGTVTSGMCRVGENAKIISVNSSLETTITAIDVHTKERKPNDCAYKSEHVGLALRGISKEQVKKGDIVQVKNGGKYTMR